jgi:hypothetical protein
MNKDEDNVTVPPVKARQGGRGRQTLVVLAISLGLTVAGLAALWGGWSSEVGSAGIPPSHERTAMDRQTPG